MLHLNPAAKTDLAAARISKYTSGDMKNNLGSLIREITQRRDAGSRAEEAKQTAMGYLLKNIGTQKRGDPPKDFPPSGSLPLLDFFRPRPPFFCDGARSWVGFCRYLLSGRVNQQILGQTICLFA